MPTKSSQCSVDAVGPVSCRHDDDMRSLFESIHQSQQLGDDASFHFTVSLMQAATHKHITVSMAVLYVNLSYNQFPFHFLPRTCSEKASMATNSAISKWVGHSSCHPINSVRAQKETQSVDNIQEKYVTSRPLADKKVLLDSLKRSDLLNAMLFKIYDKMTEHTGRVQAFTPEWNFQWHQQLS